MFELPQCKVQATSLHITAHAAMHRFMPSTASSSSYSAERPATVSSSLNSAEQPVASSVYIDERSQLQTELNPAAQIPILGCPQDHVQLPPVPESSNMLAPLEDARRKMLEETVTDLTKRIPHTNP